MKVVFCLPNYEFHLVTHFSSRFHEDRTTQNERKSKELFEFTYVYSKQNKRSLWTRFTPRITRGFVSVAGFWMKKKLVSNTVYRLSLLSLNLSFEAFECHKHSQILSRFVYCQLLAGELLQFAHRYVAAWVVSTLTSNLGYNFVVAGSCFLNRSESSCVTTTVGKFAAPAAEWIALTVSVHSYHFIAWTGLALKVSPFFVG